MTVRAAHSHAETARGANGQSRQQGRPVDHARRGYFGIVGRKAGLSIIEEVLGNNGWNVDIDNERTVIEVAGAGILYPIRPFTCRIIGMRQNFMHRAYAER